MVNIFLKNGPNLKSCVLRFAKIIIISHIFRFPLANFENISYNLGKFFKEYIFVISFRMSLFLTHHIAFTLFSLFSVFNEACIISIRLWALFSMWVFNCSKAVSNKGLLKWIPSISLSSTKMTLHCYQKKDKIKSNLDGTNNLEEGYNLWHSSDDNYTASSWLVEISLEAKCLATF